MGKNRESKEIIDGREVTRFNGNNVSDVRRLGEVQSETRSARIVRWRKRKVYYDYRKKGNRAKASGAVDQGPQSC